MAHLAKNDLLYYGIGAPYICEASILLSWALYSSRKRSKDVIFISLWSPNRNFDIAREFLLCRNPEFPMQGVRIYSRVKNTGLMHEKSGECVFYNTLIDTYLFIGKVLWIMTPLNENVHNKCTISYVHGKQQAISWKCVVSCILLFPSRIFICSYVTTSIALCGI